MTNEKVRLAIMSRSLNLVNYLFGVERGFFLREGLEVEVIVRPGRRNTEAVASGEAHFGAANECVIRRLQDLQGKRIGTPVAGSTPEIQTRLLFQDHGLLPGRDVFLLPQAPGETKADRIRNLESGSHGGLVAAPPIPFLLEAKGFQALTELSSHFPGAASHGLVATTSTITERRSLVEAMVRGYVRGVTALKTDREAAVDFIARCLELDAPLAARCYDVLKGLWSADLSLELLRAEIALHARFLGLSPIAPETIVDDRFAAIR
jgi:ABC-type nitrate/sulfonate/bicarbonate transport system substrate-binding protein